MEDIYPPESFGASDRFLLKNYFEKYKQTFPCETSTQIDGETNEIDYLLSIKELMGIDAPFNDIKHLSETCSINNLTCDGEDTKHFPIQLPDNINSNTRLPSPFIMLDNNSLTVNKQIQEWKKLRNSDSLCMGKRSYHNTLKFSMSSVSADLTPGSEFVISILVYRPVAFQFYNAKNTSEKLRFNHEIVALGRTTLAQLRDIILCSSDYGVCKEVESTSSDLRSLAKAKELYPSGFIFINDVFYNDFRNPNAINYSDPIIKWAKEKKIKDLRTSNIEGVTIESLTPRFGYPYLYMHQGDCEHLFTFADARLLNSSDCLHSESYPHVIKLNRSSNKKCLMCSVSFAKWICIESNRLPQHKVFLCTDCCNAYNYIDGKKLGNFKLYPYYEKHVA